MSRRALVLFVALGVMWGSSYTLIKVAVAHLSALDLVTYRVFAAAIVTSALALRAERRRFITSLRPRVLMVLILSSLVSFVAPYLLITWGETSVAASLAGMLNTLTPIFTALLSPLFFRGRALGRSTWVGIVVGLTGAVLVFHPWYGVGHTGATATVGIIVAAASYGLGIIVQKRYLLQLGLTSLQLIAVQLVVASILCLGLDPGIIGRSAHAPLDAFLIACALGIFNTGLTALLMLKLVATASATLSSSVTYLIAIISVFEGAVVLGEPLGLTFVAGSIVIVLGVVIVGLGPTMHAYVRRAKAALLGAS